MDQTPAARGSFWRFSLRELLLVMLAAGAFIGWGTLLYQSQRLKPTPFFAKNESWQQDVKAVYEELGEPPFGYAAGTMMHSEGPMAVQRTMVFRIPLTPEKRKEFLQAFQKRVRERLASEQCKSTGGASGSGANDVVVLGYARGPIAGTVQICVGPAGEDRVAVVVTMQEERGGGRSFGLESRGD